MEDEKKPTPEQGDSTAEQIDRLNDLIKSEREAHIAEIEQLRAELNAQKNLVNTLMDGYGGTSADETTETIKRLLK